MAKSNVKEAKMLASFPNHRYRYIDQSGSGRPPVSSDVLRPELNEAGYESYFTVNGFSGLDAKKANCINLTAFFIDIDGRKDPKELEAIRSKLEPSFITETKNGYHVYWLLDEVIFKDEVFGSPTWDEQVERWERIEQNVVTTLNADPHVKDVTRILRVPETYYWKKAGDVWKGGIKNALFKIKGIHKNTIANYSMDQMEEAFPPVEVSLDLSMSKAPHKQDFKKFAEGEKAEFFRLVNEQYPVKDRPSFKKMISGHPESMPPNLKSRNEALLVTATLMRQAGWKKEDALEQIKKVGWHGIEKEAGGWQEIVNTINSAYNSGYVFSYNNDIIAWNTPPEETQELIKAFTAVGKKRKEIDKVRFTNYEYELASRYPHLKKNEVGIVFNYVDGVYKMVSDQDLSGIVLNALQDDMLLGYRTKRNVSDKIACLLAIIPDLVLTDDKGIYFNVKNGLLDLRTKELKPHTPNFVSLVQSPVVYDPDATCPTWNACMEAWMDGAESNQKIEILQQFAGYLLTSSMSHAKALFLVGDGGNGKSTFADTLGMVIGHEGTSRIDLEDLYGVFGLKGLIGKRLNIIEEVSGNYYQSHKLKKLISGEELTINMKYKDQFKFKPQAKFIFAVNTMPRVDDSSTATERRIAVVQFNNNFRENPNTLLRFEKGLLWQELPGVLNWMIDGLHSLGKEKKFTVTQEQMLALLEYREENSSVEGFIGECLLFEEGKISSSRELYTEYKQYCVKDGRKFKSAIAFTKELKAYGKRYSKFQIMPRLNGHDAAKFEGVGINPDWSKDTDYHVNKLNRDF